MMPEDVAHFVRTENVLCRDVDAALLLLAPGRSDIVSVSGAGPLIWGLLQRPSTVSELTEKLAAAFGVVAEEIQDDVRRTVESLVVAQVVHVAAA
jgi:hypothetical protein